MHKIIIVEDDIDLLEYTAEYLILKKFAVTKTATALDFFQALLVADFDIAIIDIGLPDKSGFEIVEHLRKHTRLGIIVITAKSGIEDRMLGYNMGADHYFTKPVDSRELVAVINNHLSRSKEDESSTSYNAKNSSISNWQLDKTNWLLRSPDSLTIKITAKELLLLEQLSNHSNECVKRERLMGALKYEANIYGAKSLDALVRRLRIKIRNVTGENAPIKTIHAQGYCFSSNIVSF